MHPQPLHKYQYKYKGEVGGRNRSSPHQKHRKRECHPQKCIVPQILRNVAVLLLPRSPLPRAADRYSVKLHAEVFGKKSITVEMRDLRMALMRVQYSKADWMTQNSWPSWAGRMTRWESCCAKSLAAGTVHEQEQLNELMKLQFKHFQKIKWNVIYVFILKFYLCVSDVVRWMRNIYMLIRICAQFHYAYGMEVGPCSFEGAFFSIQIRHGVKMFGSQPPWSQNWCLVPALVFDRT